MLQLQKMNLLRQQENALKDSTKLNKPHLGLPQVLR